MTKEEMLKADLERAVKELEIDGSNTKQKVKYLLEECLEVYFKPKKYFTYDDLEIGKMHKCKLNGTVYLVIKSSVFCEQGKEPEVEIFDKNKRYICLVTNDEFTFFNDLHLELVEE